MFLPELLIVGCWIVFVAIWLAAAADRKETAEREPLPGRIAYALPLFLGSVLIFKGFSHTPYPWRLGTPLLSESPIIGWLGFAITLSGVIIAVWARRALGRNWSASVVVKQDHELVTSGPYSLVRHPIYTGFLMMYAGSALALGTRAAVLGLLLIALGMRIKLRQEETLMLRIFTDSYRTYVSRTYALIPFIW